MRRPVKQLLFSLAPLICLLLLGECVAQRVAFHEFTGSHFALDWAIERASVARSRRLAEVELLEHGPEGNRSLYRRLYGTEGKELLAQLEERYRARFLELASAVREDGARLVVLYVPAAFRDPLALTVHEHSLDLFERLAAEVQAPLVDLTDAFSAFDAKAISLLPEDFHPARFGHLLIAEALASSLASEISYRSPERRIDRSPRLRTYADLDPHIDQVRTESSFVYRLVTNREGIRRASDLDWPRDRSRHRILVLGDSVTYGLPLAMEQSFSHLLEVALPETEVLNVGVLGYSIPQQLALYRERARFLEADTVVLQVYFNDLAGLFSWDQRTYLPPRLTWWERVAAARAVAESELEEAFKAKAAATD